jgi:hypothetical protein
LEHAEIDQVDVAIAVEIAYRPSLLIDRRVRRGRATDVIRIGDAVAVGIVTDRGQERATVGERGHSQHQNSRQHENNPPLGSTCN